MNNASTMMAINNSIDYSSNFIEGQVGQQEKLLQPSLMLAPFDPNPSKTFFSQPQVSYGHNLLWNSSSSNLATTADGSSTFSSPNDDVQFQLPSFMTNHLYQPVAGKASTVKSNLVRSLEQKTSSDGYNHGSTGSNNLCVNSSHLSDDYFIPETLTKHVSDPFKSNLSYVPDTNSGQLESNYAPKKRYNMNYSTASYNPLVEGRARGNDAKHQPLYSQYALRNPSHGTYALSSQGTVSHGSNSQGTASRSNVGHGMVLLQYQATQTSVRSEDDDGIEAVKMELLFKEQVNKSLSQNVTELKANYDKLKATTESTGKDSLSMPSNFHQLFKDLTRTLNERTLELDDTKARLEAVLVGITMNKDKTITDYGSFDAQELAHRITNKMTVLRAENEALLDMVSYSNKQSFMVELGMLRSENKSLKEKLKVVVDTKSN